MSEAALALLLSMDQSLKRLVTIMEGRGVSNSAAPAAAVADDRDLDGQYGDPTVSFDPRDWTGPTCKGLHLSECPPEFLDMLAEVFDYFAGKAADEGDTKKAGYKRKDAARARGWARRIRSGAHVPPEPAEVPGWS